LPRSAEKVYEFLASRIAKPLHLTITQNRLRYISFRGRNGQIRLRLNREFLDAPDVVLEEVAGWVNDSSRSCPNKVKQFIRSCEPVAKRKRRVVLRPYGFHHDLQAMWEKVNAAWFEGKVEAPITWGRNSLKRKVRTRRLGSFNRKTGVITIHPILDRPEVPVRFLEYLIFHEMLHAAQPKGHGRPHDREFKEALRRHPDHEWAEKWKKENLGVIGLD